MAAARQVLNGRPIGGSLLGFRDKLMRRQESRKEGCEDSHQ